MPGDSLKLKIEGISLVQLRKSERPDTCRYVGTPDFAGLSRLDGKTQDSLAV